MAKEMRLAWAALGFIAAAWIVPDAKADECEALVGALTPTVSIVSAERNGTGVFVENERNPPRQFESLPPFCRVRGVARPVAGSEIGFELWLPLDRWNGRLHMVGNGGFSSQILYPRMAARLSAHDVVVSTDTGHTGDELTFALERPEAVADWAYRAVHETVLAAKDIVARALGRAPEFSYFSGCSTGGHQALMEAQRFPDDFDGIIAGAPGNNRTGLAMSFLWSFLANHQPDDDTHPIVPPEKLRLVNEAARAYCDRLDRVADGVIADPRRCRFDLARLACRNGDAPDCLMPAQTATMRRIYRGPRHARTGEQIYANFWYGSEGVESEPNMARPGWSAFWANPRHPDEPQRADFFRHWVFHNPDWDWWSFDWADDVDEVRRVMGPVVDANNPDLDAFRARGGKLIMFIGNDDPVGAAGEAIRYYESVEQRGRGFFRGQRRADTHQFVRLFLAPGMGHCADGPGATNFSTATRDSVPPVIDRNHDMSAALEAWVEQDVAPDHIVATRYRNEPGDEGPIAFQRPLCVYPRMAHYIGGDETAATSFECR